MRISYWSSDVCSSDLSLSQRAAQPGIPAPLRKRPPARPRRLLLSRRARGDFVRRAARSEEHTSELQSLMRISYAVFCLKKKKTKLKSSPYCPPRLPILPCKISKKLNYTAQIISKNANK